MTNTQRLTFIQYQLEMLQGVVEIANQQNEFPDFNVLYTDIKNKLCQLTAKVQLLKEAQP